MASRRILVAATILGLLASLGTAVPAEAPLVRASTTSGTTVTYYVSDGVGDCESGSRAADTSTGSYEDDAFAIQDAVNLAATDGTDGAAVIHLCAGTFDLSSGVTITASADTELIVEGEGTGNTTVRRSAGAPAGGFTLFSVTGVPSTFRRLTVRDAVGSATADGGAVSSTAEVTASTVVFRENTTGGSGGAIFSSASVTISDGTFIDNTAGGSGGAVAADSSSTVSVVVRGTSRFEGNLAADNGGAVYVSGLGLPGGTFDASGATFVRNRALAEDGLGGGAVYAIFASVYRTSFEANSTPGSAGALAAWYASGRDADFISNVATGDGGAVWTLSRFAFTGGHFTDNRGGRWAGAIYSAGMMFGPGPLFGPSELAGGTMLAGNRADGGGAIVDFGMSFDPDYPVQGLAIDGAEFSGNTAVGSGYFASGGAIYVQGPLDITGGTFRGNSAPGDGGAVQVSDSYPVTVRRSTFSGNVSAADGGAIFLGGSSSGGPITIEASTFDSNEAVSGGAIHGGSTVATVRNATFYENTANTGDGGAFEVATLDVTNGTFVGNAASGAGDHVAAQDLSADDTIFAAGDCDVVNTPMGSGSFDEDGFCVGAAPTIGLNLGRLGSWGGPTKTVKLISPSDAIDSTPKASGACLSAMDQRDTPRPQGPGCDAGAYEVLGTVLTYTGPSVVYTTGDAANVTLTGSTYSALAGCDLRFSISDGTSPSLTADATTGLRGSGSVTFYRLSAGVYEVVVSAIGDCAGLPDASGVVSVVNLTTIGRGTAGGGSYKVDGFTGRLRFAHAVQVRSVTSKVGRATITTTTTKGSLLWTYKNLWRLKANINYSSTDGSATYGLVTCNGLDFSGSSTPTTFPGKCARFSGAALLQVYDTDLEQWVASSYTRVTFVASVYDGGSKSVCSKTKCTTTDYPDWFGLAIRSNNVALLPETSPEGVATSLMRTLQKPDGNGSLWAY